MTNLTCSIKNWKKRILTLSSNCGSLKCLSLCAPHQVHMCFLSSCSEILLAVSVQLVRLYCTLMVYRVVWVNHSQLLHEGASCHMTQELQTVPYCNTGASLNCPTICHIYYYIVKIYWGSYILQSSPQEINAHKITPIFSLTYSPACLTLVNRQL